MWVRVRVQVLRMGTGGVWMRMCWRRECGGGEGRCMVQMRTGVGIDVRRGGRGTTERVGLEGEVGIGGAAKLEGVEGRGAVLHLCGVWMGMIRCWCWRGVRGRVQVIEDWQAGAIG